MSAFPINWGFGGIAFLRNGPMGGGPKLYVCFRFASHSGRKPIGFTVEWLRAKRRIYIRRMALRKDRKP